MGDSGGMWSDTRGPGEPRVHLGHLPPAREDRGLELVVRLAVEAHLQQGGHHRLERGLGEHHPCLLGLLAIVRLDVVADVDRLPVTECADRGRDHRGAVGVAPVHRAARDARAGGDRVDGRPAHALLGHQLADGPEDRPIGVGQAGAPAPVAFPVGRCRRLGPRLGHVGDFTY